jgi:hypothetical protein
VLVVCGQEGKAAAAKGVVTSSHDANPVIRRGHFTLISPLQK